MRRISASLLILASAAVAGASHATPAGAMASHRGWPPYDGMLLMNEGDSNRPLLARAGMDPFGGRDHGYGCKDVSKKPSSSCKPWFEPFGNGYVVRASGAHHRLYGGHGDDTIVAGNNGDVIWGDYKPSGQPTSQHDILTGGDQTDFIYASHGRNIISGGAGDDVIHAHFGRGKIDCGPGRDIVYVKKHHKGAYKRSNCEVISTKTGESAPKFILRSLPWRVTDSQVRQ